MCTRRKSFWKGCGEILFTKRFPHDQRSPARKKITLPKNFRRERNPTRLSTSKMDNLTHFVSIIFAKLPVFPIKKSDRAIVRNQPVRSKTTKINSVIRLHTPGWWSWWPVGDGGQGFDIGPRRLRPLRQRSAQTRAYKTTAIGTTRLPQPQSPTAKAV